MVLKEKKYNLFVAIAMIVGIVIGSGIFFKSDDILRLTNGNISVGILVFMIGAISIIFGSLAMGTLASITDGAGGIISYADQFCNRKIASAFGWFNTLVYYPGLSAVLAWVSGIYISILFGIEPKLETQILIGLACMILFYIVNILSAKFAGLFQGASTIIKLIPLIIIGIGGLVGGDVSHITTVDTQTLMSTSWLLALAPMAFSFDGWYIATNISSELKNSKKNLPLALFISPILILIVYIAYFIGISSYVGPEKIIELGDSHVQYAAINLLGNSGANIIITFVVISVLGTLNGVILGGIRMPYSLATKNLIPFSDKVKKINKKLGISIGASIITCSLSLIALFSHYILTKYNVLGGSDISEISIVFNYILFIFLYIAVIRLANKKKIKGIIKGYVVPCLAIFGSLIIFFGSMGGNNFWFYILFSFIIFMIGYMYSIKSSNKSK